MSMDVGGSSGPEINVTPLIDIVLVLLIIFMVITPMANQGAEVELPKATELEEEEKEGTKDKSDALTVSVDLNEKLWVDGQEVTTEQMIQQVSKRFTLNPSSPIVLRADNQMLVGPIRKLMRQLKEAGAKRISLAIEVEKNGGEL